MSEGRKLILFKCLVIHISNLMTDMNELIEEVPSQLIGNNEFTADFFDDASAAWRSNKIIRNQGTFEYKCQHMSATRKKICGKKIYVRRTFISTELLCWYHCRS